MSPMSKSVFKKKTNWLLICPSVEMSLKIMEKCPLLKFVSIDVWKKKKKEAKHSYYLMSKFYKKKK